MKRFEVVSGYFRSWRWIPFACALLLAAGTGLHWGPSRQWQADAQWAYEQAAARPQSASARSAAVTAPGLQKADLQSALPAADSFNERLRTLTVQLRHHRLRSGETDISYPAESPAGVSRWRVVMPVQGEYADLRAYMQEALTADRALSLDALRITRPQVELGAVQAELVWTLYGRTSDQIRP